MMPFQNVNQGGFGFGGNVQQQQQQQGGFSF